MTDTAQHTPGPWTVYVGGVVGAPHRLADSAPVAKVNRTVRTDEEAEANARLIAAAPDLLAALKDAEIALRLSAPHASLYDSTIDHARRTVAAAIAKAEGRS